MSRMSVGCGLVVFLLLGLVVGGCGGGDGAPGAPEAPQGPPAPGAFVPGAGSAVLATDFAGKTLADVTLTSTEGLRVVVPQGTCVRTIDGARVVGSLTIGLDDAGGAGAWPDGAGLLGVARLHALLGPPGSESVTHVRFDPHVRVEADLGRFASGGLELNTWIRDGEPVHGGPPGGPPDSEGAVSRALGMADVFDEHGQIHVPVPQTGVFGIAFVPTVAAPPIAPLQGSASPSVHEVELPGTAAETEPSVKAWKVINPDTAEIVAVFNAGHPGMTNGDGQIRQDGTTFFSAHVITRDGKRYLHVRTNYDNRFVIVALMCGDPDPVVGDPSGGSEGEGDESGEYVGAIKLRLRGWGGYLDAVRIRQLLTASLGAAGVVIFRSFDRPGGGPEWFACMESHDYGQSTRTLAAHFPPEWMLTFRNRRIDIQVPCPPQRLVTTTFDGVPMVGGGALHVVDPGSLVIQDSVPLEATPFDVVVDGGAQAAYVASPDLVQRVDLVAPGRLDAPVPGVKGAIGLTHTEDLVLAATAGGSLVALRATDLVEAWRVDTLPAQPYGALAVSRDGAFAYCASPTGQVVPVDLLRRVALPPIATIAADSVSLSGSGLRLAAVDAAGGGVRLVDLEAGVVGPLQPTGVDCVHAIFAPDGGFLIVANRGSDTVTLLDLVGAGPPQFVATQDGPNCLALSVDPIAGLRGHVACLFSSALQPFSIGPGAAITATQPTAPQPNVVRGNGE